MHFQLFDSLRAEKKALMALGSLRAALMRLLLMQYRGRTPDVEETAMAVNVSLRKL